MAGGRWPALGEKARDRERRCCLRQKLVLRTYLSVVALSAASLSLR